MPFTNTYSNLPVLITGHTGFKGSWLTTWLLELGATVIGYSLPEPPTQPSNFVLSGLSERISDVRGDIRDFDAPVSYTHLDVYKRQAIGCAAAVHRRHGWSASPPAIGSVG